MNKSNVKLCLVFTLLNVLLAVVLFLVFEFVNIFFFDMDISNSKIINFGETSSEQVFEYPKIDRFKLLLKVSAAEKIPEKVELSSSSDAKDFFTA